LGVAACERNCTGWLFALAQTGASRYQPVEVRCESLPGSPVSSSRKKVLHIAYDPVLVGVQRRLMQTSVYEVFTVFARDNPQELDLFHLGIDVVLIDHSASFEERWAIVRRLKLSYPNVPVVALRRDALDEPLTLADHQVSIENPADWLDTIAIALV
jgi:CheY-like chemotaxis protein